ncbi:hypothetical protein RHMOL_Rhmol11G0111300 [Rhododendron molle]|uniref:Uncharacterized protein n=1 Tax=Rhododendron molle TaxID=49168 RepID=A0ACC0LR13_RHOML|nr:hypothetical protein RHMOL_Rhmol11G0111300 [Rhododendron molle]
MESLHESVGVVNEVILLDGLRKYLEDEKTVDAGDEFKQKFALYALGALLYPTMEVKVTFSKPNQMNDHLVDVVKTEIYDDMRHDIGELKHMIFSMKEKIMNWEQKANAPGDGVETRQQIGELKDVVYNLHQKKNNGEESDDGPSIEFVGVKEGALKKGRKGQVIKEKEATGSPPAEHSLPILGSQRGRGRGGAGHRGRGRGQTKSSLMHATTQSVDMGDTSSCNDDYVAPITRSEEERRPAPCVRSPYYADGVKKVQNVNQVQTTSMLTDDDEDVAVANVNQVQN